MSNALFLNPNRIDEGQAHYLQTSKLSLSKLTVQSLNPGIHFVATGAIHADEPSGHNTLLRLYNELADPDNPLRLLRGRLTIFPSVNQAATFTKNHQGGLGARGVHRDGNRNVTRLKWGEVPKDHERLVGHALDGEFKKIIARQIAQTLLTQQGQPWVHADFHDVPFDGPPHSVISGAKSDLEFAKAGGLPTIVSNWRDPQLNLSNEELQAIGRTRSQQKDFTRAAIYAAREHGASAAVTFEGGYNQDGKSTEVNYEVLRNLLTFTEQLEPLKSEERGHTITGPFTRVSVEKTIYKTGPDVRLSPHIQSDDQRLEPGQIVVENSQGGIIVPDRLDQDGFWRVLHPIPDPKPGDHLVHLAYNWGPE